MSSRPFPFCLPPWRQAPTRSWLARRSVHPRVADASLGLFAGPEDEDDEWDEGWEGQGAEAEEDETAAAPPPGDDDDDDAPFTSIVQFLPSAAARQARVRREVVEESDEEDEEEAAPAVPRGKKKKAPRELPRLTAGRSVGHRTLPEKKAEQGVDKKALRERRATVGVWEHLAGMLDAVEADAAAAGPEVTAICLGTLRNEKNVIIRHPRYVSEAWTLLTKLQTGNIRGPRATKMVGQIAYHAGAAHGCITEVRRELGLYQSVAEEEIGKAAALLSHRGALRMTSAQREEMWERRMREAEDDEDPQAVLRVAEEIEEERGASTAVSMLKVGRKAGRELALETARKPAKPPRGRARPVRGGAPPTAEEYFDPEALIPPHARARPAVVPPELVRRVAAGPKTSMERPSRGQRALEAPDIVVVAGPHQINGPQTRLIRDYARALAESAQIDEVYTGGSRGTDAVIIQTMVQADAARKLTIYVPGKVEHQAGPLRALIRKAERAGAGVHETGAPPASTQQKVSETTGRRELSYSFSRAQHDRMRQSMLKHASRVVAFMGKDWAGKAGDVLADEAYKVDVPVQEVDLDKEA